MADQYEFLTKDNITNYLSSKKVFANLIDANNLVEFKEVGDGNLNLVFIMKDSAVMTMTQIDLLSPWKIYQIMLFGEAH